MAYHGEVSLLFNHPPLSSFLQTSYTQQPTFFDSIHLPRDINLSAVGCPWHLPYFLVWIRRRRYRYLLRQIESVMRRRQTPNSSDNSDGSDSESCFDAEDEVDETDSDTNPTDFDTDVEGGDEADITWITEEDKDHPPEYYLNQEEDLDESDDEDEDYADNSLLLLDGIEERWYR